ncbi:MAG: 3-demethylubiquinone-9 3-O-methyltransferase [Deltaproteobacteria bacterium]|nr:3-demethylubiquinone-9 3-O-methyltransferase [Deltaproteobacteria bacterium]
MSSARINNSVYNTLGDRWYQAYDDPIALLRAESRLLGPWILKTMREKELLSPHVIDLGCGGGFISNFLARNDCQVTGVDLSLESLEVARKYDETSKVRYLQRDVCKTGFPDKSFDVAVSCDVLEHVENPRLVVEEARRLLKPGGLFFFHTFNRTLLSKLVTIKLVEVLVKNTPRYLHVHSMFIQPKELETWCLRAGFSSCVFFGVRPSLASLLDPSVFRGVVPKNLAFKFCKSMLNSYAGFAVGNLERKPLGARRWFGGNCAAGSSKKSGGGDASLAPPNPPLPICPKWLTHYLRSFLQTPCSKA